MAHVHPHPNQPNNDTTAHTHTLATTNQGLEIRVDEYSDGSLMDEVGIHAG